MKLFSNEKFHTLISMGFTVETSITALEKFKTASLEELVNWALSQK